MKHINYTLLLTSKRIFIIPFYFFFKNDMENSNIVSILSFFFFPELPFQCAMCPNSPKLALLKHWLAPTVW